MRVLIIDPSAFTPYYDFSLAKALACAGCQVELATTRFPYDTLPAPNNFRLTDPFYGLYSALSARLARAGPGWLRRGLRAAEYPIDWLRLLARIQAEPPHIVHVQWAVMPELEQHVFRRLKALDIPLVFTLHDIVPHHELPRRGPAYARLYALADRLIVHTHLNRAELLAQFQVDPDRVHVVPQGNLADFVGPPLPKIQAREKLGLAPAAPVVLFFGLIKPYKGLAHLIRALAAVKGRIPGVKLLVVGQANEDFRPYTRLIAELGLAGAITVHLRYVPHAEMPLYFGAADVVVLPYVRTYGSAVLFTAYTFGRPVVATATGGLPEDVEEGQTGWIVPPADERALAGAIIEALSDAKRLATMGERAAELARTKYAWTDIARQTMEVYSRVVR